MSPSIRVRTRWDDCDRHGHVNNAAYLALLREATDRAFPTMDLGRPAEIVIDYRSPLPRNVVVDVGVEADAGPGGTLEASYSFALEGRVASTARVRWRGSASTSVALP